MKIFGIIYILLLAVDVWSLPDICNTYYCKSIYDWDTDGNGRLSADEIKIAIEDSGDGVANFANPQEPFHYLYFPALHGPINYLINFNIDVTGQLKMVGDPNVTLWAPAKDYSSVEVEKKFIRVNATGNHVDIRNLRFENMALRIQGNSHSSRIASVRLSNNFFINHETRFLNIPQKDYDTNVWDHQLNIINAYNVDIVANQFNRDANSFGRGLYLDTVINVNVMSNTIRGYYSTAINISGTDNGYISSQNIVVKDNNIHRHDGANFPEDHGIYAYGYYNLNIEKNNFSGWSSNACGFAIKVKNSQRTIIKNNSIADSGILTSIDSTKKPLVFSQGYIFDNKIGLSGRVILHDVDYCGDYSDRSISYTSDKNILTSDLYIFNNQMTSNIFDHLGTLSSWNNTIFWLVDSYPDWRCGNTVNGSSLWYRINEGADSARVYSGTCQSYGNLVQARFFSSLNYPNWACFNYHDQNKSFWISSPILPLKDNYEGNVNFSVNDFLNGNSFGGKCLNY